MSESRLVVFAHGSRDPAWQETFARLLAHLRADLGDSRVALAFLERAEPTLPEAIDAAAEDHVSSVQVLPMFFSSGGHVTRDIPGLIDEARTRHPGMKIEMLPPIGEHPSFAELVGRVARSALD